MSKLPITFACGLYDRMLALHTKEVQPDGIDLNFLAIDNPREIFDRMSGALEFDASEMSSSEFVARHAAGDCPFVALPVFPSRVFRHGHIAVNRRSIASPKDLAGKRIGVPLYTMTAAIFIRGLLQHDFGVDLSQVRWIEGAINEAKPHGHPTKLKLAKPVSIEPNASGKSLSELLEAGEIAGHHRGRLAERGRPQPGYRAPVRGLPRAGDGLLPPHADLSDHASGGAPPGRLRAASVRGHQPLPGVLPSQGPGVAKDAPRRHAALYAALDGGRRSRRSTRSSAATPGLTGSSPTGRRSRRWCNIWPSRA